MFNLKRQSPSAPLRKPQTKNRVLLLSNQLRLPTHRYSKFTKTSISFFTSLSAFRPRYPSSFNSSSLVTGNGIYFGNISCCSEHANPRKKKSLASSCSDETPDHIDPKNLINCRPRTELLLAPRTPCSSVRKGTTPSVPHFCSLPSICQLSGTHRTTFNIFFFFVYPLSCLLALRNFFVQLLYSDHR